MYSLSTIVSIVSNRYCLHSGYVSTSTIYVHARTYLIRVGLGTSVPVPAVSNANCSWCRDQTKPDQSTGYNLSVTNANIGIATIRDRFVRLLNTNDLWTPRGSTWWCGAALALRRPLGSYSCCPSRSWFQLFGYFPLIPSARFSLPRPSPTLRRGSPK